MKYIDARSFALVLALIVAALSLIGCANDKSSFDGNGNIVDESRFVQIRRDYIGGFVRVTVIRDKSSGKCYGLFSLDGKPGSTIEMSCE